MAYHDLSYLLLYTSFIECQSSFINSKNIFRIWFTPRSAFFFLYIAMRKTMKDLGCSMTLLKQNQASPATLAAFSPTISGITAPPAIFLSCAMRMNGGNVLVKTSTRFISSRVIFARPFRDIYAEKRILRQFLTGFSTVSGGAFV